MSHSIQSIWPSRTAWWIGVRPRLSQILIDFPFLERSWSFLKSLAMTAWMAPPKESSLVWSKSMFTDVQNFSGKLLKNQAFSAYTELNESSSIFWFIIFSFFERPIFYILLNYICNVLVFKYFFGRFSSIYLATFCSLSFISTEKEELRKIQKTKNCWTKQSKLRNMEFLPVTLVFTWIEFFSSFFFIDVMWADDDHDGSLMAVWWHENFKDSQELQFRKYFYLAKG